MPYYAQRSYRDGKSRNDNSSRTFTGSWNKRKYHSENYIHTLNESIVKITVVKQIWIPKCMLIQMKNLMGPKVIWVSKTSFWIILVEISCSPQIGQMVSW